MKDRRPSKIKQKQLQTKNLEDQTKKMQDKLNELKRQVEEQKKMRTQMNLDSTVTRWQKTARTNGGTLKSFAKQVLEEQKQAHAQFGINHKKIYGTKTFEGALKKIRKEKEEEEERNPTKITTFLKEPSREESPKMALENNFFKAKMDIKKLIKQKTLEDFLQENFILEYLKRFKEQEITDLEGLRYISKERLSEMGVKAGHQVKIIKKIKEEFDKMLGGKVEQPVKQQKPVQKVEFGYGQGDINEGQGEQPEGQGQDSIDQKMGNLHLQSKLHPEQEQTYSQQEQDVVLITVPTNSIEMQVNQHQQYNCYECYKLIMCPELHYDQKYFCSEVCMETFMVQMRKICPACGKGFVKTEGYRQEGLWFCSLGCCPNQEEIEEMFFKWHTAAH